MLKIMDKAQDFQQLPRDHMTNVIVLKNNVLLSLLHKVTKSMALYFVPVSQSTGGSGLQLRVRIGKLFSLFLIQSYVVGTQKNCLNETVLLSTQNTCLNYWVRK